ncbi:MAG: sigma 54-interacting transcriptional regulator [Bryobacterales bacterium]|nr:sigma 54-interacting transcriptional regulator [Bryobacterales bacterium]
MIPKLVAIAGPLNGSSFTLPTREAYLGRAPYNWLTVNSPTVSRQHLLIEHTAAGEWVITDLDSHNGTFVNDLPVKQRVLSNGDSIRAGDSHFVFVTHEEDLTPPDDTPVAETMFDTRSLLAVEPGSPFLKPPPATATKAEKHLNALLRLSAAVQSVRTLEAFEEELIARVFDILPAQRVVLYWRDGAAGLVALAARAREAAAAVKAPETIPAMVQQVLSAGVSILGEDATPQGRVPLVVSPLVIGMQVRGALYLEGVRSAPFTRDHVDLANAIATLGAAAADNLVRVQQLNADRRRLLEETGGTQEMVGEAAALKKVLDLIRRVAPAESTVLILGENGTGKELAARAIHRGSPRREKPFIAINCATLKDALLESELFGHEKGAFTGAVVQKKGRIEMAEGGTLFLDEIGELDPALQAKLLRVLQEREFERVGGNRTLKADVRIIAATNRDIRQEVREGRFREDLFYRLNVVSIEMPPLRQRKEDIGLLVSHFISRFHGRVNRRVTGISAEARALLQQHDWPGNVRELENTIERAMVLGSTDQILPEDLPESLLESEPDPALPIPAYHLGVQEAKRRQILDAVQKAKGNISEAARALGVHPNYLHRLVTKLGLRNQLPR